MSVCHHLLLAALEGLAYVNAMWCRATLLLNVLVDGAFECNYLEEQGSGGEAK